MDPAADVIIQIEATEHVHRGARIGDNVATLEADNLDDAGPWREITAEELATVDPSKFCGRCFPEGKPAPA